MPQVASADTETGAASTAVSRLLADWNTNKSLFDVGDGEPCPHINTGGNCWWWSANAWMALISYAEENPTTSDAATIAGDLSQTYSTICGGQCPTAPDQHGKDPFTINTSGNTYFDDIGWWEQMWINAYKFTKTVEYLYLAEELWNYVTDNGFKPEGCGGVVQYHKSSGDITSGADAFANALYLRNSAWLYSITGNSRYMAGGSVGGGAVFEAGWIKQHLIYYYGVAPMGSPGAVFMIADHVDSSCDAAGSQSWLQSQGEMVNAWTDMYAACKAYGACDAAPSYYNNLADELARTVIGDNPSQNAAYQSEGEPGQAEPTIDNNGILSEPCEPTSGNQWPYGCALGSSLSDYQSYLISKGFFERAVYCSNHNFNDSALTSFAARNAASLAVLPHFGFLWDSTGANDPVIFPTQTSVLDGLDANLGGSYAMC
jgi:hypothetical protein